MNSHDPWTAVLLAALVAWWVVVVSCGLVLRQTAPEPVTLEVTRMSRRATRATRWTVALAAIWRALSWLAFLAALDGLSLRAARRAGRLERRGRPRARPAAAPGASGSDQERTLASSPCSPWARSLPPSAPRPVLPEETEETRQWERTLPWGTPSPLLTREGMGKPYPFVPLAETQPSDGTVYRSPPRTPRRPPPPVTGIPVGPRRIRQ
jgi:hypothetical protein